MSIHVTDTHPLIWYVTNQHSKLSKKAHRLFDQARNGQGLIYVPTAVFWETSFLLKSARIRLHQPFEQWANSLLAIEGFDIAPLDIEVIAESLRLNFNNDPFDVAIVATARIKDLPLITKDQDITSSQVVEIEW
jgi:PIN domain nuclease of toxin-antitoxin system